MGPTKCILHKIWPYCLRSTSSTPKVSLPLFQSIRIFSSSQTYKKFLTFLEPSLELKYFLGKCGIFDILNIVTNSMKSCLTEPIHTRVLVFIQRPFKEILSDNALSKKFYHTTPFQRIFFWYNFHSKNFFHTMPFQRIFFI